MNFTFWSLRIVETEEGYGYQWWPYLSIYPDMLVLNKPPKRQS